MYSKKVETTIDQLNLIQHQINNPLSVILGNVQISLLKKELIDQKLIKRLELIEKSAMKIDQENKKLSEIIDMISESDET